MNPWYGVDLDGTIAEYDEWRGPEHIGAPIPKMIERVKRWLYYGDEVRIFTARVFPLMTVKPNDNVDLIECTYPNNGHTPRHTDAIQAVLAIQKWCKEHLGQVLTVTCVKDYGMLTLYDDRAVQVEKNTGRLIGE